MTQIIVDILFEWMARFLPFDATTNAQIIAQLLGYDWRNVK